MVDDQLEAVVVGQVPGAVFACCALGGETRSAEGGDVEVAMEFGN
jgi:hypothetical protein